MIVDGMRIERDVAIPMDDGVVLSADANSCQGSSATNANTGYGTPSDGIFANRPKKMLNTIIVITG